MAPKRGGGGGGSFRSGKGSGGSSAIPDEPQIDISSLFGRFGSGNSVFSRPELLGSMVVYIIYGVLVLVAFILCREPWKKQPPGDKRIRITWTRITKVATVLYLIALGLQSARWGILWSSEKVGESFRFEEPVTELLGGITEAIILGICARLAAKVLATLVPKSGPDPALAKLRKWYERTITALWVLLFAVIIAQSGLGFALAKDAFAAYKNSSNNKSIARWRLADRPFVLQLSEKDANIELLAGTYSNDASVDAETIWTSLITRFISPDGTRATWMKLREAQIKLEVARYCLVLVMILGMWYVALRKKCISNVRDRSARKIIGQFASTITRGYLYIVFPSLLFSNVFALTITTHYNLHNFSTITSLASWLNLRLNNKLFFDPITSTRGARPYHLSGWLPGYRTTFQNFPVFFAVMRNFGWVVTIVLLAVLATSVQKVAKKDWMAERAKQGKPFLPRKPCDRLKSFFLNNF